MQEWVTVIIVLLIVAILLDGVRRMRIAQRDKIRMSRSIYKKQNGAKEDSAKDIYPSELPNGGARVISKREASQLQRDSKKSHAQKAQRNQGRTPEQARLSLDESVPLLMESVVEDVLLGTREADEPKAQHHYRQPAIQSELRREQTTSAHTDQLRGMEKDRIEPTFFTVSEADSSFHRNNSADSLRNAYAEPRDVAEQRDDNSDNLDADTKDQQDDDYEEEPFDEDEYSEDDYQDEDEEGYEDDEDDYEDYADEDGDEESAPVAANQIPSEPEEVLIINIMAFKGETFNGSDLLDIVLKCGMRYGDMDIFHRYSDAKGEGALLFSMANMVKPGTFDLDAMEQFETPGVSLFMTLPLNADSMQSFDLMVDTARAIAETLDGELKDEQRSVMTRQTIEHCRQRIRDFELKRLSRGRH